MGGAISVPDRGSGALVHGRKGGWVGEAVRGIVDQATYGACEIVVVADDATPQAVIDQLILVGGVWVFAPTAQQALGSATPHGMSNTEALGRILYTDYVFYFQIAGLVLLVAMIGAIVLTLRQRPGVRRQSIAVQNARDPAKAVEVLDPKPGQGA